VRGSQGETETAENGLVLRVRTQGRSLEETASGDGKVSESLLWEKSSGERGERQKGRRGRGETHKSWAIDYITTERA